MKYEKQLLSREPITPENPISVERKRFCQSATPHFHPFFEIEVILGGQGRQILNGAEYPLRRGSIYLLTPADFHSVTAEPTLEMINVMFHESLFPPALLGTVLSRRQSICFSLSEEALLRAEQLCSLLMEELSRKDPYTHTAVRNLTECLLMLVLRALQTETATRERREETIEGALRYLYLHFRENPSCAQTAQACGYTVNYFGKLFARSLGEGYVAFLNRLKINHAKLLLSSTQMSGLEVALACGFSSLSAFHRTFRKQTGMTPRAYRKSIP